MYDLIVNEMFTSIDGEVNKWHQGRPSFFIRLAGCNLNCSYCDTVYAQGNGGTKRLTRDLVKLVKKVGCKRVTISGGEPLLQRDSLGDLISNLVLDGFQVSVETNGSILVPFDMIKGIHRKDICWVLDWKTPCSGYEKEMKKQNFLLADSNDWVKFVIQDRTDYEFMKERLSNIPHANVAASPVTGVLDPGNLVQWLVDDKLYDVVVNLQLHKIIWPTGEEKIKFSTFRV
jgi:7-carboxy-7-deazaguanine synthase